MNFKNYFREEFPVHFRKLNFKQPNRVVRGMMMNDPNVLFFGGRNWENFGSDIENIPKEDRQLFILALFMTVISDQNLYRYFKDEYPRWRERTMFPKFGWSGFGPHIENPMKILSVPEEKGYFKNEDIKNLVVPFVEFCWNEAEELLERFELKIDRSDFFQTMVNDPEFENGSGELANHIRDELIAKCNFRLLINR